MTELEAYKQFIVKNASEASTDVLPNAGKDHAAIVMTEMFKLSKNTINMVVGSLDGNVSNNDEYLKELKDAIERGVSVNILFLNDPNEESQTYKLLRDKKQENPDLKICFKKANQEVSDVFKFNTPKTYHFAVFDKNKYRLEKDTEKYLAWVCFNDPNMGGQLYTIFEGSFNKSAAIA